MDIYNKLRELNDNDIEDFNLNNKSCIGKVTKVFNGKNLKIILLLDGIILKFNCYLCGVKDDNEGKYKSELKELVMDSGSENYKLLNVVCGKFNSKGLLGVKIKEVNDKMIALCGSICERDCKELCECEGVNFNSV